jgi:hypothetical protein
MNEFGTVQRQPDGSAGELKVVGALVSRLVNKVSYEPPLPAMGWS